MAECTVYSPCGRYVVRFTSDAQHQRLSLDVRANARRPDAGISTTAVAASSRPLSTASMAASTTAKSTTPVIVWPQNSSAAPPSLSKGVFSASLHLVATLGEADVVALTSSAGVRKSFANFAKMLYDALIGRSACVHFYVETVEEMKERIQRDVQQQQQQQQQSRSPPSPSPASSVQRTATVQNELSVAENAFANGIGDGVTTGVAAALRLIQKPKTRSSGGAVDRESGSTNESPGDVRRVRAAVGDTVIELDEDIADEVLEQRFLTVDYDVDFTRAIFPIPLLEPSAAAAPPPSSVRCTASATAASTAAAPSTAGAAKPAMPEVEGQLRLELRDALTRVASLERDKARLQKENAALMQLSRQKMQEMQRLCDDFQSRVQGAADAEKLRAKNAELRVQLQEAVEERQTVLRTLERERSQRRLLSSTDARRSLSSQRDNPYLRSLSRDSKRGSAAGGGGGAGRSGSYSRRSSMERGEAGLPHSRPSSRSSSRGARLDRHGQPLLSPAPTPGSRRRVPTRFDTPPGPTGHRPAARSAQRDGASSSSTRHSHVGSGNRSNGGGGDSPAPRDRTGGRQVDVVKPRRSLSSHSNDDRGGSRASLRSSSLPRRGPSLWADTSDNTHPSPRGSVTSSRASSASHERLYRATTASSRQHQTPKAYALEELGARRAVFH